MTSPKIDILSVVPFDPTTVKRFAYYNCKLLSQFRLFNEAVCTKCGAAVSHPEMVEVYSDYRTLNDLGLRTHPWHQTKRFERSIFWDGQIVCCPCYQSSKP